MDSIPGYVVPGQIITKNTDSLVAGAGVEVCKSGLRATLLGQVLVSPASGIDKPTVSIHSRYVAGNTNLDTLAASGNSTRARSRLPQVGDIVYARVLRITPRDAALEILSVEDDLPLVADQGLGLMASQVGSARTAAGTASGMSEIGEGYGALVRSQDVRATERDKVKMEETFNPGDIIRASVLSIGDGMHYFLSTIRNDFGVVFARSKAGKELRPRDWQTMEDDEGNVEHRKCANPFI